ncbi:MAG: tetratricopeptide repeat protein [Planctomycetota bacterium]|jgi:tetratricopeptide (TPR) repeat protein
METDLARRYFDLGHYDSAAREVRNALQLDPSQSSARLLQAEIDLILDQNEDTNSVVHIAPDCAGPSYQALLYAVRELLDDGRRHLSAGEYDAAEEKFRTILEYAKWIATGGPQIDECRRKAEEYLDRISEERP